MVSHESSYPSPDFRLGAVALLFLLLCASFSCIQAQGGPGFDTGIVRPNRPTPPKVSRNHPAPPRPGNRATILSPEEAKRQSADQAIIEGNEAFEHNDYEKALASYRKVTEDLGPKDERAYYGLGNVYNDLYCYDSAIAAYLSASKLKQGQYLDALVGLGYAYAAKERYDDAEQQFRAALELKRDSADANIGLGRTFLAKGKYQEAITQINLVINSASVEVKERATAHVALGDVYWKQEKRADAVSQFEEAIRLKPDLAWAYVELGNAKSAIAFSKVGSFSNPAEISTPDLEAMQSVAKEAIAKLEDAGKYGYDHPNLREHMALALAYQRRYEDARKSLSEYFDSLKRLESRFALTSVRCDSGFDRLKADGYWYEADIFLIQGLFESDDARKNEFLNSAIAQVNLAIKAKQDHAGAHWLLGSLYSQQKRYEEAISEFRNAILFVTEEPSKAALYGMISTMYEVLGRRDDAFEAAKEAVKRDPGSPSRYRDLGSSYISQGKLEDALVQLKKAEDLRLETSPADSSVYLSIGVAYGIRFVNKRNELDYVEAAKALKKAIEIKPRFPLAYNVLGGLYLIHNDADEALANYEKASAIAPQEPMNYVGMGRVYFELKHNDVAAIERFKKAIEVDSHHAEAYRRLALVYRDQKNDTAAIDSLLKSTQSDPKFLQGYLELANVYRSKKNYDEAIKVLNSAISTAPKNPRVYQQLGIVYMEQSKADDALTNFRRAMEYDPRNAVNYLNVALVYVELKHDDEAAIKNLLTAIEIDPNYLDAYSKLAEIYRRQKNYSEGIRILNIGIKNVPSDPWTYKDLAKVYEAQGDNKNAIQYYEQAISHLSSNDSGLKDLYLGRIERLRGNYSQAIDYFKKMNLPNLPDEVFYELGVTYVAMKNRKAALDQLQQLKKMNSDQIADLERRINEMK